MKKLNAAEARSKFQARKEYLQAKADDAMMTAAITAGVFVGAFGVGMLTASLVNLGNSMAEEAARKANNV